MVFFKRRLGIIILAAFLLMAMGIISNKVNLLEEQCLQITSPFQCVITFSINQGKNFWNNYIFLVNLRKENQALIEQIKELESERSNLIETRLENRRLRSLLGFKHQTPAPMVLARVIAEDTSAWFKTILIDKGSLDGAQRRMPVVVHEGIVGQVVETSKNTSRVLLITDPRSAIDVRVQKSRAKGILQGRGKKFCQLKYIALLSRIEPGDKIISSGLGGVFPQGLLVGEIVRVEKKKSGLFQYVEVAPGASFATLEEVFIVLTLPPFTQDKAPES